MKNKGAGARIAWSINSKKTFHELSLLFEDEKLERLEFEDGEIARELVLEKYNTAQTSQKHLLISSTNNFEKFTIETKIFIESNFNTDQALIFLQKSESRGVYRTNRSALAKYSTRVLAYDGDCIQLTSKNLETGILLDIEKLSSDLAWYESYYWST
ncbi:hypothetical protein D9M70_420010 [compost metagenome]